jgi:putative Holliday junction resolvase
MTVSSGTIAALDLGTARVGVAIADLEVGLAHPVDTLHNDNTLIKRLRELRDREHVTQLVIGLPRGLEGQTTSQTEVTQTLGLSLAEQLELPVIWQDEALTSTQAEAELKSRGKPYAKEAIDALSAVYILEDYLRAKV